MNLKYEEVFGKKVTSPEILPLPSKLLYNYIIVPLYAHKNFFVNGMTYQIDPHKPGLTATVVTRNLQVIL